MKQKFSIKPLEQPYPLSASRMNLFLECPVHYFFRYRTDIPKQITMWPGTLNGSALHQIFEDLSKDRKKYQKLFLETDLNNVIKATPTYKEIFDKLLEEHKKYFKKSRKYNYDEFITKGEKFKKVLTNFFLNYFTQEKITSELELSFNWLDDDILLTGFLDLLLEHEGKLLIADLKTTTDSAKFYSMDWQTNLQNIIYTYLIYKKFKKFPESFSFIVLNHEDKLLFIKEKDFNLDNFEKQLEYLDSVICKIRDFNKLKDLNKIAKFKTFKCNWCEYQTQCKSLGD